MEDYRLPLLWLGTIMLALGILFMFIYADVRRRIHNTPLTVPNGYMDELFKTASAAFVSMFVCTLMGALFFTAYFMGS